MSRALVFVVLAIVAWGAVPLLDKVSLKGGLDPIVALTIRATGTIITLVTLCLVTGRLGLIPQVPLRGVGLLMLAGVTSSVVGMWFYFSAMQMMDAAIVVALTSTYPALTMVLSWAIFGEKLNARQWLAIAMIVGGVVLLEYASTPAAPPDEKEQSS